MGSACCLVRSSSFRAARPFTNDSLETRTPNSKARRRERDSNPRYVSVHLISNQAPSATRSSLRGGNWQRHLSKSTRKHTKFSKKHRKMRPVRRDRAPTSHPRGSDERWAPARLHARHAKEPLPSPTRPQRAASKNKRRVATARAAASNARAAAPSALGRARTRQGEAQAAQAPPLTISSHSMKAGAPSSLRMGAAHLHRRRTSPIHT